MTKRSTAGAFAPTMKLRIARTSLMIGTALGCSIAIVAASPNMARAADECGNDVAEVAVCTATSGTGNPYPTGITYTADAGEDITVVAVGGGPLVAVNVVSAGNGIVVSNANAGFDAEVDVEAGASVSALADGVRVIAASGDASIDNAGDIEAGARGLFSYGATGYISNSGSVVVDGSLFGAGYVHGLIANGVASSEIVNSGTVSVTGGAGDFYVSGIWAYVAATASVESSGAIGVTAANGASMTVGIAANSTGATTVTTTTGGTINVVNSGTGNASGVSVSAGSSASVTIGDDIYVESVGGDAWAVNVTGATVVDVSVTGDIYSDVDDVTQNNYGIAATSTGFSSAVTVVGDITISDGLNATGIDAAGVFNTYVDVTGDIQVGDGVGTAYTFNATGIEATSSSYAAFVDVVGDIDAYGATSAMGVFTQGNFGSFIDIEGDVYANATTGDATGIQAAFAFGPSVVTVVGDVAAAAGDDAIGIQAGGYYGAFVTVTGDVSADATDEAIGISVLGSLGASAVVTGNVTVESGGAAQGIQVTSGGSGVIEVTGNVSVQSDYAGAVGLAVNAPGAATITLTGDLYSDVDNPFMSNTGIDASGGSSASVNVTGDITISDGGLATAITADATGAVTVDVTGDIQVGDYAGSFYTLIATGVIADSNGSSATVTLDGDVTAYGYLNGYGVRVDAGFGNATLNGSGDVIAVGSLGDAIGADLDAPLGYANLDFAGDITVSAADDATGIAANGYGVDIVLDGDISAAGESAWGILATSGAGDININVGDVTADAGFAGGYTLTSGAGIEANTLYDVTIIAGDILTYGDSVEGISIQHQSAYGDPDANAVDITVGSIETNGDFAEGMFVDASADVTIAVSGAVDTSGNFSTAILATTDGGAMDIDAVDVTTTGNFSVGIDASAFTGVDVTVTGTISTSGTSSAGVNADTVNGDAFVSVVNVYTLGNFSDGAAAASVNGDAYTTASGEIYTGGYLSRGLVSFSAYGDADIVSTADVETIGGRSIGLWVYAVNGDASVTSTGDVETSGAFAYGISAGSHVGDAYAYSSGVVTTAGDNAFGIAADSYSVGDATVVSTGAVYTSGETSHGLYAFAGGGLAIVDNLDGHVETSGDYADGIFASGYDGVRIYNGANTVITSGYSAVGIYGLSPDSYVFIDSATVITTGDNADGIRGVSLGTDATDFVTILSDFVDTAGADSTGIYGGAVAGDVYIDSFSVETVGANSNGIHGDSGTGDVEIHSFEVFTDGTGSTGILGDSAFGEVTIYSGYVDTEGDFADGITGRGAGVDIESTVVYTRGYNADGILAYSYGGSLAAVDSFSVTTLGDYATGITVHSEADGGLGGAAYVNSSYVHTEGEYADGILATSEGADARVLSYQVETYGDNSTGIATWAYAHYDAGAVSWMTGESYTNATTVYTAGADSIGIYGWAAGGDTNVYSASLLTVGDNSAGIRAVSTYFFDLGNAYSGDVYVGADEVVTRGDNSDGIYASSGGGRVDIVADTVEVFGLGSDAIEAVTNGSDASNSDDVEVFVYGDIYSADGRGVAVDSAGSSYVYVGNNAEVYGYDWGIQSASADGTVILNNGDLYGGEGRAIDVDGGAAYIENNDYILGFVDLSGAADHFENDSVWETYGTSSFRGGIDDVDNDGFLGFSRYTGAASTTFFTELEFFDNASLISGYDNQVDDVLSMVGATFTGTGASEFEFDVQLGGPGSLADRLIIGSAAGSTLLTPNDVLAGQPGVLNFAGILVVDSANPAEVGNEFHMANIDKGWVEYELFFDAPNDNWLIVALPDDEVFELLGAMSASQDFWHRSGDAWTARMQEIRDGGGEGGTGRSDGWELWMQAHAGEKGFDRVQTFDIGGFGFTQDLSANSDWRGFQFGFDNMSGDTLWGLTMGFVQQETRFDVDQNSFDLEGWNIGGYAGWAANGLFANAVVKADFFEADANFNTLPDYITFDGVTWGAKGEIGYRWDGEQMFFEPIASLAWTTTELDSFTSSGAAVDFDNSESLIGKAGARIGATFGSGAVVLTPYIGVYAVAEFEGENTFAFTSGPTTIAIQDEGRDNYGQADFGFTAQTFYGLEGFVKGEWNFGGDADGGAARLGVRWRW